MEICAREENIMLSLESKLLSRNAASSQAASLQPGSGTAHDAAGRLPPLGVPKRHPSTFPARESRE
jgi:hypothetical protein